MWMKHLTHAPTWALWQLWKPACVVPFDHSGEPQPAALVSKVRKLPLYMGCTSCMLCSSCLSNLIAIRTGFTNAGKVTSAIRYATCSPGHNAFLFSSAWRSRQTSVISFGKPVDLFATFVTYPFLADSTKLFSSAAAYVACDAEYHPSFQVKLLAFSN